MQMTLEKVVTFILLHQYKHHHDILMSYNTAHLFSKPPLYHINLPACVFESAFQESSCFLITFNYFSDLVELDTFMFLVHVRTWVNQAVVWSITEEHQLEDAQRAQGSAVELISSAYRWQLIYSLSCWWEQAAHTSTQPSGRSRVFDELTTSADSCPNLANAFFGAVLTMYVCDDLEAGVPYWWHFWFNNKHACIDSYKKKIHNVLGLEWIRFDLKGHYRCRFARWCQCLILKEKI